VTRITVGDDGCTVGIVGLTRMFAQLVAMGHRPVEDTGDERLAMVNTRNYAPSSAERYRRALLCEYSAFQASKDTKD